MKNENDTNGAEAPSSIPLPNVKEHAPPPLKSEGAEIEKLNGGCCVSSCSESSSRFDYVKMVADAEAVGFLREGGIIGCSESSLQTVTESLKSILGILGESVNLYWQIYRQIDSRPEDLNAKRADLHDPTHTD